MTYQNPQDGIKLVLGKKLCNLNACIRNEIFKVNDLGSFHLKKLETEQENKIKNTVGGNSR